MPLAVLHITGLTLAVTTLHGARASFWHTGYVQRFRAGKTSALRRQHPAGHGLIVHLAGAILVIALRTALAAPSLLC